MVKTMVYLLIAQDSVVKSYSQTASLQPAIFAVEQKRPKQVIASVLFSART
ncbi:MAG TPA: hypothetical protein VEJ22_06130 [Nitrospirota bacterium]|nr:hypothetical protein [Nitrospirota bacterium]